MKNKFKLLPIVFLLAAFIYSGCDEFQTIPLNIPVTVTFTDQTGSSFSFDTGVYCLDAQSETFQEYQDDIKEVKYLEAAYRTISNSNANVTGNISAVIYNSSNQPIATFQINNVNPSDYINSPLIIGFSQTEVQAINSFLVNSKCFRVEVSITSLSGTTTISGAIDVVFEALTEL